MSLTEILEVKEHSERYVQNIFSSNELRENIIAFKLISRALLASGLQVKELSDNEFLNIHAFQNAQKELVAALAELGRDIVSEVMIYQSGTLAKCFGVSQTTISNWIAQNRFEGISRPEPGKHVDIPSNTVFTYPSGKIVLVKDIVAEYEERVRRAEAEDDEATFLRNRIQAYEERYGTIEQLEHGIQSGEIRPSDGGLDLDVWRYLIQRSASLVG